jgi:asparagine synthase (glutamine-hydrolysing)
VDRRLVEAMAEILRHRGPDAAGYFFDGNVGFGHRRLTIIDTSEAANQPMFNEDGSVVVVYNGEIYNFQQLAEELVASGHRFRTRCDTEVIVHAWEEWGRRSVERFRGMFAFALYDAGRRQLFLARDRLGKKPLYYSLSPRRLAFASEIKALRLVPEISSDLDFQALGEYATYGYPLGERTIYCEVRRLPPAHTLRVSISGDILAPEIESYWEVKPAPDETLSEEDWLDRLDETLSQAVRLRLISDVPLGAFLSGGIDSSLVVAYMAEHSPGKVQTFTMGSPEASHDESAWGRAVAEHLGTDHHMQMVTPDAVGALENLVDTYDEPFADESAIPTFHLAKLTRQHVKVALSGDGGDESFLGYPRYFRSLALERIGRLLTPAGRRLVGTFSERLPYSSRLRLPLQRVSRTGFDLYNHAMGYCDELLELLHSDVRRQLLPAARGKMARDFDRCESPEALARYADVDLKNYLPDDILVKVDRASMYHSLEVRCPLLDHELVELAARVPTRLKRRGTTGKWILRRLLRRHLPAALIDRPKRGFGVPLSAWFQSELAPMLERMVADRRSPMWRYFDHAAVSRRFALHQSSRADLYRGLWGLPAALWRALFFYHWSGRNLV